MEISSWLLYVVTVFVATASPGPNVVLIILHSTRHGLGALRYTITGNLCALFIFASASALGIGLFLNSNPSVLFYLRLIGAMYLLYMGITNVYKAIYLKKTRLMEQDTVVSERVGVSKLKIFVESFTCTFSNPKPILFLASVFPQFLDVERNLPTQFTIMFLSMAFIVITIHVSYALIALKSFKVLDSTKLKSRISLVSGICFVIFGLLLLPLGAIFS